MIISYVILHFGALEVTLQCIQRIINIKSEGSSVVVVDNCSPDNSGEILKNKYDDRNDVHIILNKANIGFANGNNIGYSYARDVLKSDIVVDINNDVFIDQPNFETIISEIVLNNKEIGVISPVIINRKGKNQNPFRLHEKTTQKWKKQLRHTKMYYWGLSSSLFWKPTLDLMNKKNKALVQEDVLNVDNANKESIAKLYEDKYKDGNQCYNIIPHGSCVIFTPSYLSKSPHGFVPVTFFYCEEDILFDYLETINLVSFYTPLLYVAHMEKVSTNSSSVTLRDKALFQMKNRISSIQALLQYREKIGKE